MSRVEQTRIGVGLSGDKQVPAVYRLKKYCRFQRGDKTNCTPGAEGSSCEGGDNPLMVLTLSRSKPIRDLLIKYHTVCEGVC